MAYEHIVSREDALELLKEGKSWKVEEVYDRLLGLDSQNGLHHITVEAIGRLSPSILHQSYIAGKNDRVSDQFETAVAAIAEEANGVLTSNLLPKFVSYVENVNLKKQILPEERIAEAAVGLRKVSVPDLEASNSATQGLSQEQQQFVADVYDRTGSDLDAVIDKAETKARKPRAKKVEAAEVAETTKAVAEAPKTRKPRAKKAETAEKAETKVEAEAPKVRKPRTKKVEATESTEAVAEAPKPRKPRAKKAEAVESTEAVAEAPKTTKTKLDMDDLNQVQAALSK